MSLKAKSDLSQRKRNLTFATDKSLCYWYCDKLSGGRGREGRHSNEQNEGYTRIWAGWNLKRPRRGLGGGGDLTVLHSQIVLIRQLRTGLTVWFFICAFVIWAKTEMASGKWQVADCNSLREVVRGGGGRLTAAECEEDRTSGNSSRTCPLLWQDKEKAAWPERTFINFTQST